MSRLVQIRLTQLADRANRGLIPEGEYLRRREAILKADEKRRLAVLRRTYKARPLRSYAV